MTFGVRSLQTSIKATAVGNAMFVRDPISTFVVRSPGVGIVLVFEFEEATFSKDRDERYRDNVER